MSTIDPTCATRSLRALRRELRIRRRRWQAEQGRQLQRLRHGWIPAGRLGAGMSIGLGVLLAALAMLIPGAGFLLLVAPVLVTLGVWGWSRVVRLDRARAQYEHECARIMQAMRGLREAVRNPDTRARDHHAFQPARPGPPQGGGTCEA